MNLVKAFGIKNKDIISLVGGGGKTTLMFALAHEFSALYPGVVTTTTTKILEPLPDQSEVLILENEPGTLIEAIQEKIKDHRIVTVAEGKLPSGKLKGINPKVVSSLREIDGVSCVIVEADGAAGKPLKAPNETEPVFPESTSLVIPVVGVDSVGKSMREIVFRSEIATGLLNVSHDTPVTPSIVAELITHPSGIMKGRPLSARVVPFINKMDMDPDRKIGGQIALEIIARRIPEIEMVLLGRLKGENPSVVSIYI